MSFQRYDCVSADVHVADVGRGAGTLDLLEQVLPPAARVGGAGGSLRRRRRLHLEQLLALQRRAVLGGAVDARVAARGDGGVRRADERRERGALRRRLRRGAVDIRGVRRDPLPLRVRVARVPAAREEPEVRST